MQLTSPDPEPAPLDPAVQAALEDRGDWVSSWWVAGILVGLAVLLVVVAIVLHRRGPSRHRDGTWRRPHLWFVWVGSFLSLVLGMAIGVNAYVGYLPNTAAVWKELGYDDGDAAAVAPSGTVTAGTDAEVATISSPPPTGTGSSGAVTIPLPDDLGMPDPPADTWIYTPPGYDPSGETLYPVIYLHHGDPGNSSNWFESGIADVADALITTGSLRPVIVVGPDTNAVGVGESDCQNSDHGGSQVESYLTGVVVPWVDAHYAVAPGYAHRAIGGMSSGAYCSLDHGLRHQDEYGAILAIMPFDAPGTEQISDPDTRAQHVITDVVPTMTFTHPMYVYLAAGSEDPESEQAAEDVAEALQARDQPAVVTVVPDGEHTWNLTMSQIPVALQYWEKAMQAFETTGS